MLEKNSSRKWGDRQRVEATLSENLTMKTTDKELLLEGSFGVRDCVCVCACVWRDNI